MGPGLTELCGTYARQRGVRRFDPDRPVVPHQLQDINRSDPWSALQVDLRRVGRAVRCPGFALEPERVRTQRNNIHNLEIPAREDGSGRRTSVPISVQHASLFDARQAAQFSFILWALSLNMFEPHHLAID